MQGTIMQANQASTSRPHKRRSRSKTPNSVEVNRTVDSVSTYEINSKYDHATSRRSRLHRPPPVKMSTSKRWSITGGSWLAIYFLLNLTLTLYNKVVLNHFPFPYTLTALHALCGSVGTFTLLHWNSCIASLKSLFKGTSSHPTSESPDSIIPPIPTLRGKELVVLLLYSVLYSVNIVVSNVSLRLVTVPFHQVVRASTPFFTVVLAALLLGSYCSRAKMLTLIPVIAGVGFATYGDYYFTPEGFFLTILGTVLAALKTITTNLLQKPVSDKAHTHSQSSPLLPTQSPPLSPITDKGLITPLIRIEVTDYDADSSEPKAHHIRPENEISSFVNRIFPYTQQRTRIHPQSPLTLPKPLFHLDLPRLTLSPLQLLYLLSPVAFVQTALLAHASGELHRVNIHLHHIAVQHAKRGSVDDNWSHSASPRFWLLLNGFLAFLLNVVSFSANRKVGPLAMSVAANVKQVLAVLCSVTLFNLHVTVTNGTGIFLTLLGGAWYAAVELQEKRRER